MIFGVRLIGWLLCKLMGQMGMYFVDAVLPSIVAPTGLRSPVLLQHQ
jgi:hypothetical protein